MNYVIKPQSKQFIADNWLLIILCIACYLFAGINDTIIRYISAGLGLFLTITLGYGYLWLYNITWIVTSEQLIYTRGIISRKKDFLELYRVIDFQEHQNILQRFMGLKSITITSGDKSHPVLIIFGVKCRHDLIRYIRLRVEYNKKIKSVYEITNR